MAIYRDEGISRTRGRDKRPGWIALLKVLPARLRHRGGVVGLSFGSSVVDCWATV